MCSRSEEGVETLEGGVFCPGGAKIWRCPSGTDGSPELLGGRLRFLGELLDVVRRYGGGCRMPDRGGGEAALKWEPKGSVPVNTGTATV